VPRRTLEVHTPAGYPRYLVPMSLRIPSRRIAEQTNSLPRGSKNYGNEGMLKMYQVASSDYRLAVAEPTDIDVSSDPYIGTLSRRMLTRPIDHLMYLSNATCQKNEKKQHMTICLSVFSGVVQLMCLRTWITFLVLMPRSRSRSISPPSPV
jgi:hypothetical protein